MGERGEEEIEVVTSSLHQMSHLVFELIRSIEDYLDGSHPWIHWTEDIFNLPPHYGIG